MKYVVLARDKKSDMIVESFGVYKHYENASNRMATERCFGNENFEYCVEEVDPLGSYSECECED